MKRKILLLLLFLCSAGGYGVQTAYTQVQRRSISAEKRIDAPRLRAESIDKWLRSNGYTTTFTREKEYYQIDFKAQGYDLRAIVSRESHQCRILSYMNLPKDVQHYVALWVNNILNNRYFGLSLCCVGEDYDSLCFDVPFWIFGNIVEGERVEWSIGLLIKALSEWKDQYEEIKNNLEEREKTRQDAGYRQM